MYLVGMKILGGDQNPSANYGFARQTDRHFLDLDQLKLRIKGGDLKKLN